MDPKAGTPCAVPAWRPVWISATPSHAFNSTLHKPHFTLESSARRALGHQRLALVITCGQSCFQPHFSAAAHGGGFENF